MLELYTITMKSLTLVCSMYLSGNSRIFNGKLSGTGIYRYQN